METLEDYDTDYDVIYEESILYRVASLGPEITRLLYRVLCSCVHYLVSSEEDLRKNQRNCLSEFHQDYNYLFVILLMPFILDKPLAFMDHKNSPVYESMVQAGLSSLGKSDVQRRLGSECNDRRAGTKPLSLKVVFSKQVIGRCVRLLAAIKRTAVCFSSSHMDALMIAANRILFNKLSVSPLLSEEDGFFLQSFQDQATDELKDQHASWRSLFGLLIVVLSMLVVNTARLSDSLGSWFLLAFNTAAAVTTTVILACVLKMVFLKQKQSRCETFLQTLQKFLDIASQSLDTLSRSIRFIQEAELVARGFTFVDKMSISRVLGEHQKLSYVRQCPDLRQEVFFTAKAQFLLFRQSFKQLVESCPVKIEVAGVTHYCSEIPLSQYPEIVQINNTDPEAATRLQEATNSFSVDILKSMLELSRIHVSEFIRRLAVCFLAGSTDAHGNKYPFPVWKSVLQAMTCDLEAGQAKLQSLLDAHRRGPLSSALCDFKPVRQQSAESHDASAGAYPAMHSLELHLLAALKRVQNVAKDMEAGQEHRKSHKNQDVPTDAQMPEKNNRKEWSSMLCLVRSELNACIGCCEEAAKRLEVKTSSDTGNALVPLSAQRSGTGNTASDKKVIKLSSDDAPIILDEVFEGFSEEQESGPKKSNQDLLSTEEAGLKEQRKNVKMCLQELDAIIAVRAAERALRERAALERMSAGQQSSSNPFSLQQQPTDVTPHAADGTSVRDSCDMPEAFVDSGGGRDVNNDDGEDDGGGETSPVSLATVAELGQMPDAVDVENRCDNHTSAVYQKGAGPLREESQAESDVSHPTFESVHGEFAEKGSDMCSSCTSSRLVFRSASFSSSVEDEGFRQQELEAGMQGMGPEPNDVVTAPSSDDLAEVRAGEVRSSDEGDWCRDSTAAPSSREPETIGEYLSLPGAPSPIASGLAAMVASRARTLQRSVETFGDSSSSDEISEDDNDGDGELGS